MITTIKGSPVKTSAIDVDLPDTPKAIAERDWQQTYTGKAFRALDPDSRLLDLRDIAHQLSLECRFNGAVKFHYSVARHCLLVEEIVSNRLLFLDSSLSIQERWLAKRLAMLHDASEFTLKDIPKPLKPYLPAYKQWERRLEAVIFSHYLPEFKGAGVWLIDHNLEVMLDDSQHVQQRLFSRVNRVVKEADLIALVTERTQLLGPSPKGWVEDELNIEPYNCTILKEDPSEIEQRYLARCKELGIVDR